MLNVMPPCLPPLGQKPKSRADEALVSWNKL
jgi:hypothetical protein